MFQSPYIFYNFLYFVKPRPYQNLVIFDEYTIFILEEKHAFLLFFYLTPTSFPLPPAEQQWLPLFPLSLSHSPLCVAENACGQVRWGWSQATPHPIKVVV